MKKTIALLLSALLCLSVVPTYALEQNGDTAQIQSGKKGLETVRLSDSAVSDALKKAAEEVQGLINNLPALDEVKNMTNEEQQSAYMEIQKAYEAYEALTEEEKTKITGAEVFPVLLAFFTEGVSSLINKDFEVTGNDYKYTDDGVLTVNNGANLTISMKTDVTNTTNCIVITKNAKATIILNGVNINSDQPAIEVGSGAELTLVLPYNVENELTVAAGSVIDGPWSAGISVPDGAILNIVCGEHSNGNGSCNDNCGSLTAKGGSCCAGIGGEIDGAGGKITIKGGLVSATGGDYAAGIGGADGGTGGEVTISGGVVNAEGGYNAAGIGGGDGGAGGEVTISGGVVNAEGGYRAAGIGGGDEGAGGDVTISGGVVKATGGSGGAVGIGEGLENSVSGTFSTGTNGNAVIFTNGISDHSEENSWSGVIFEGTNGKVYGTTVTPELSFKVSSGSTLTIPEDTTLVIPEGVTLTNDGNIKGEGSRIGKGKIEGSGTSVFPKNSKITLEFDKKKYQYNDTVTITAKISPDTTGISPTSARESQLNENEIVFYVGTGANIKEFKKEITIDSTTAKFNIKLSADNGFAPGDNIISAKYGGNTIGFYPSSLNDYHINLQESNLSDDTAGNVTNSFTNGNIFFPSAPPVSNPNGNTITPSEMTAGSENTAPNAVTTGDQSAENVNAFVFDGDNEESSDTYGESNNPAESGGEQNSDAETNAVINKNGSDLTPSTGNGGSVTLIAVALVSLVGIGGISLYNKKKKR